MLKMPEDRGEMYLTRGLGVAEVDAVDRTA